jgi:hypothetical protein
MNRGHTGTDIIVRAGYLATCGMVAIAVLLLANACSSSPSASGSASHAGSGVQTEVPQPAQSQAPNPIGSSAPAKGGGDCSPGEDLIVWSKVPGAPVDVSALGSYDSAACKAAGKQATLDMLQQTSQTGSGYCTVAAPASANPGYEKKYIDSSAANPPKPKGIVFASASC